jgi:hypothetical protein
MHDITDWNVMYQPDEFFEHGDTLSICRDFNNQHRMNESWFDIQHFLNQQRRRRLVGEVTTDAETVPAGKTTNERDIQRESLWRASNTYWHIVKNLDLDLGTKVETWAQMVCEYKRGTAVARGTAQPCEMPEYIETCDDMERNEFGDIDITLDELLNKDGVRDSECLKGIRIELYDYCSASHTLHDLCNGLFDPRC